MTRQRSDLTVEETVAMDKRAKYTYVGGDIMYSIKVTYHLYSRNSCGVRGIYFESYYVYYYLIIICI